MHTVTWIVGGEVVAAFIIMLVVSLLRTYSFKISVTGLSQVMITFRDINANLLDCHMHRKISNHRWFHVAITYDSSGILKGYINGIESPTSCTDEKGKVSLPLLISIV